MSAASVIAAFVVRRPWLSLAIALLLLGAGGLLVAASGVVPIRASSGHWAITEWLLQFSKRRSVSTYALLIGDPPPHLDTPSMVLRGAGHFETGCRPCHGGPGDPLPPVPQAMTPPPPNLADRVFMWNARELFYIVKHGIKFTGMPAWPALERDDEIWAMVGFLRRVPQMTRDDYERLVRSEGSSLTEMFAGTMPEASPPDVVVEVCARCHGIDGRGRGPGTFPVLAGQRFSYLDNAMRAYAERRRHSGIMATLAGGLPEEARHAAARYYAALPPPPPSASGRDPAEARRGEEIATRGVPAEDIPSCLTCHTSAPGVNDAYPRLQGQDREYIVQQLHLLKARTRGGSEFVHIMQAFVDRLTPAQIQDVASYFAAGGSEGGVPSQESRRDALQVSPAASAMQSP